MGYSSYDGHPRPAWNAGRQVGAKRPLKQKEVWAIRFWLEQEGRLRDRALFDLAIDSKLRGCEGSLGDPLLEGSNSTRVVSQLAASGLFVGETSAPAVLVGTRTDVDAAVLNALGGGLLSASIRITLFDGEQPWQL